VTTVGIFSPLDRACAAAPAQSLPEFLDSLAMKSSERKCYRNRNRNTTRAVTFAASFPTALTNIQDIKAATLRLPEEES
jgi:hypothetical protein